MKTKNKPGFRRLAENRPVQQDSKFSNFGICCSIRPSRTVAFGACFRRAIATTTKAIFENRPAQRHSKFSKLGNCPLSPLCLLCPLVPKNTPAQRDSKFSKLGNCPLSPLCLLSPLDSQNRSAQRHSIIYNLGDRYGLPDNLILVLEIK